MGAWESWLIFCCRRSQKWAIYVSLWLSAFPLNLSLDYYRQELVFILSGQLVLAR